MILTPKAKRRKKDLNTGSGEHSIQDKLLNRLEQAQQALVPESLQAVIAHRDLLQIFHYFKSDPEQRKTRERAKREEIFQKIASLKPYGSFRLDKNDTHLPRTLTILCDGAGELKLLVETKSKLANNQKQDISDKTGGFKIGKPAWRIDDYEEYFNLVAKLESRSDYMMILEEVNKSTRLSSEYVNQTQLGPVIVKKNAKKVSIYSTKAISNLHEFIINNGLTRAQIDSLTLQLLSALKYLHNQSVIHQDLKSANILVYGTARKGYYIKISDFGNSVYEDDHKDSLSTWNYSSPEILSYYKHPDSLYHAYFNEKYVSTSFGQRHLGHPTLRSWGKSNKANDVWAMGVVIFELRYGVSPEDKYRNLIDQDPLLSRMLAVNRNRRFTSEQAFDSFESTLSKEIPVTRKRQYKLP